MSDGRYNYNPANIQANFETFPAGDYLLAIGTAKPFVKKEGDEVKNWGIRFTFTIADGEFAGKKGIFTAYLHNDGSQSMTKRFQMAAMGYKGGEAEEKRFNAETMGDDWNVNPETGELGAAWKKFEGANIISEMTVGKNDRTGDPQQNFKGWRPAVSE